MPYLPVDLDAKRKAHGIERALGLPRHAVAGGLTDLWEVVWRDKSDVVDDLTLDEAFGPDPRIRAALVARGFIEPVPESGHRVRGAAKWLFGLEGKSRGGQAAKANLIPGPKPKSAEESKRVPSASAEDQPKAPLGTPSALSPNTQHPAPRSLLKDSPAQNAAPGFELVQPEPRATKRKRVARQRAEEEPPDPRHTPTRERCEGMFQGARGMAYRWGARDGAALKALLKFAEPDEVVSRFGRGLHSKFPACNTLSDLLTNWNAYGPHTRSTDLKNGKAAIRAEDIPREAFAVPGEVPF